MGNHSSKKKSNASSSSSSSSSFSSRPIPSETDRPTFSAPAPAPAAAATSVSASAPASPSTVVVNNAMQLFEDFAKKFKIKNNFLVKLRALGSVRVVLMLDDSTSMNADAYSEEFLNDPYEQIPSRFQELKRMVQHIVDMAGVLSKDPIDVYFLNRAGRLNVRSFAEIETLFSAKPTGLTPTVKTLRYLIEHLRPVLAEQKVVLFLATDGQPTNDDGDIAVEALDNEVARLMKSYPNLYITFMAAVSDEKLLEVMDKYGEQYERIGVVDEYRVERKEQMEKHKGDPSFQFTSGDYITKALLCALNPEIKALFRDEDEEEGQTQ